MSSSSSCPTCGEHISFKGRQCWKNGIPSFEPVYPEVGDIVVCDGCDSKAEIVYINEFEPDFLEMDFAKC